MLLLIHSFGPVGTNAALIACEKTKEAALIDAPLGCLPWVKKLIKEHHVHLGRVLLTHSHWDHIAEAAAIKREIGAQVFVHKEDAENLRQPGSDQLPLVFPLEGVAADGMLADGMVIPVGEIAIQVLHTPGHSPGGICFYLEKEGVLFSGDTLFQGTIGKVNFPTSSPEKMWSSLKKLAKLPKATKVYPGHGESTTIGEEGWITQAQERFS